MTELPPMISNDWDCFPGPVYALSPIDPALCLSTTYDRGARPSSRVWPEVMRILGISFQASRGRSLPSVESRRQSVSKQCRSHVEAVRFDIVCPVLSGIVRTAPLSEPRMRWICTELHHRRSDECG